MDDSSYVFDINKNEKNYLISFGEYDSYSSEFSILIKGFAFNNILWNYENDIINKFIY